MFVYQNANRDICVTFESNKPVENPEYVIAIDHDAGTISVNGQVMEAVSTEAADSEGTEPEAEETPVEEPTATVEDDTEAEEE